MDKRNNILDGLRGMAAFAIVCFHVWLYNLSGPIEDPTLGDTLAFEARTALIFFFILSGYLIWRPFARAAIEGRQPIGAIAFLRRRATRIVPAYYVAIVGAFVLMATVPDVPGRRQIDAEWLPAFFLFVQNYFPATTMNLNGPTWTLAVEVGFYLVVTLLALIGLRRRGWHAQLAILAGLVATGVGWNALSHSQDWGTIAAHTPFPFLPYFALGMLVAVAGAAGLWRPGRVASAALALGGVALIVLNGFLHTLGKPLPLSPEIYRDLPGAIGMTAILAAATIGSSTGIGWLASRPLAWIGEVSYGLYLWHVPVIVWLNGHGLLPDGFLVRLAIVWPLALGIGAASWYLVERPLLRRERELPRETPPRADDRVPHRDAVRLLHDRRAAHPSRRPPVRQRLQGAAAGGPRADGG